MKKKGEVVEEAIELDINPLNPIEGVDYFTAKLKKDFEKIQVDGLNQMKLDTNYYLPVLSLYMKSMLRYVKSMIVGNRAKSLPERLLAMLGEVEDMMSWTLHLPKSIRFEQKLLLGLFYKHRFLEQF